MAFTIEHTQIGDAPYWYHLECAKTLKAAAATASLYVLRNGGYICVRDENRKVVYGTDPAELDRAILSGINKSFPRETARRIGCCVQ
jgi:hypothetical protein